MPEVFANTTPLQYLHRLGRLDWLREFYGRIVVPVAVADELEAGRRLGARVPELTAFPWIEIRRPPASMPAFPRFIHRGEAEVLALAQAADDPLVIIDDLLARAQAQALGLQCTGTLGVLLRAKRERRVERVASVLAQLQAEGFRIAPATLAGVLRLAGE
jgi:predicted nucleic acid-binding protein